MSLFTQAQVAADELEDGFGLVSVEDVPLWELVEVERDVRWIDDVPVVAVVRSVVVGMVR